MYTNSDNIVALATLVGKSALSVVRLSGCDSKKIFQKLTKTKKNPLPNHVYPKYIYSPSESDPFDFASIVYYKAPKSFTGEDGLEISVHGGVIMANRLLETLFLFGARQALPGEFSFRAFKNNKIDLLQAEGISAIVQANNSVDSYYLLNNIKGGLSKEINKIIKDINALIMAGEYEIDFTDEEMTEKNRSQFLLKLKNCYNALNNILKTSYTETQNLSSVRIAIVGLPNVGKSSIFNHILGQSQSIVTNEKGTTRDIIEKEIYIGTTLVSLIDTAGLRKTKNKAETIGIQKTYKEIIGANIIIVVDDVNPETIYNKFKKELSSQKTVLVHNKIDLIKKPKINQKIYNVSCKSGEGFDDLLTELLTLSKNEINFFNSQYLYLLNKRQKNLLEKIKVEVFSVMQDYIKTKDLSACLSGLYIIRDQFGVLVQPNEKEEILYSIFKGFCVGK